MAVLRAVGADQDSGGPMPGRAGSAHAQTPPPPQALQTQFQVFVCCRCKNECLIAAPTQYVNATGQDHDKNLTCWLL